MDRSPSVRTAQVGDVPLILDFIRAAAEEQAPGAAVAATVEGLSRTLHLDPPSTTIPGAPLQRFAWPLLIFSPDQQPVGLLIYFYNYSTWSAAPGVCLEELYVVPQHRRDGYARILIEAMASAAEKAGCVKMDWVCLTDNDKALRFYEKIGARKMEDWVVLKVDRQGIKDLSYGRPKDGPNKPFKVVSGLDF